MSGYGGNLTYPDDKFFVNDIGTITTPGSSANKFYLITDKFLQGPSASSPKVLVSSEHSLYMLGGANASYSILEHADSVAKVVAIELEKRAPSTGEGHELGFNVVATNKKPGVYNDNFYGYRRTYAHIFKVMDPFSGGYISDLDLMRAYSDINQQITDDHDNNAASDGNVESVVSGVTSLTFSADVSGGTFDIPAAGLYGKTLSQVADYVDSAGTTVMTNTGGSVTKPGYGFIVHVPGSETITAHKLTLTTKDEYKDDTTYEIEKLDGTLTVTAEGSFEVLPWEDVYREFANMAHDTPLSNMHYVEKPDPSKDFWKITLESPMEGAAIHGASHGNTYKQRVVMYVSGSSTELGHLKTLISTWAS